MKELINTLIPYLVVLAQVFLITILIFSRKRPVGRWLSKNSMRIVFIISILATLGSLFYSKIMGYNPCELCWYQRILMYPIVVISGFSLNIFSSRIRKIIITLAAAGGIMATYQYATQLLQKGSVCVVGATDCSTKIVFKFGYISIPLMAATAFAIILAVLILFPKKG